MRSFVLCLVAVACLCSADARAADRQGTWKLNVDKSDFGGMPGPKSLVMTIKETDQQVLVDQKMESDMGDMDMHLKFDKGKESVNQIMGMEFHTKLSNTSEGEQEDSWADLPDGGKIERKAVSKVSDDGKVMTSNVWMKSPMGEANQKLIFDKQ